MITIFTNHRLNKHLPILICILIFPLTVFLSGCYSTRTEMVTEDKIPVKESYEIINVTLKNNKVISLEGMEAKFILNYKDKQNLISYTKTGDYIRSADGEWVQSHSVKVIELKDVKLIKIEIHETTAGLSILGITLVIITIGMIYLFIKLSVETDLPRFQ